MSNLEDTNRYKRGGFHPTHIGDLFYYGRYKVAHKLGHGQLSTVWLVKDLTTTTYAALKILAADASKWSRNPSSVLQEIFLLQRLRHSAYAVGKEHVVRLLNSFVHIGPNGKHQCIVTEVMGPSLYSDMDDIYPDCAIPPRISRSIIKQIAQGVSFLHQNRIVHGDLHANNILLTSPKLSSLRDSDVESELFFGRIVKFVPKGFVDGARPSPHFPRYFVLDPEREPLLRMCLSDPDNVRIKICDFSEASIITPTTIQQPKWINTALVYRPPEVILHNPTVPTFQGDIWALAVLFHMLACAGMFLFTHPDFTSHPQDEVLKDIVLRLGKLPEPYWSSWTKRSQYFDEHGNPLKPEKKVASLLRYKTRHITEEEYELFEKMLRFMLALNPAERPTIQEAMNSDWFVIYCSKGNHHSVITYN